MDAIKEYLLSVTAAAVICGLVTTLAGKSGSISGLLKLLCGLFMCATVIKPAVDVKLDDVYNFTDQLAVNSDLAVSRGEEMAEEEMKRIIKDKTETYILDKANALGAEVDVEIILEDVVPAGVTVTGDLSPFAKSSLAATITQDLGIPPEEQIWNRT